MSFGYHTPESLLTRSDSKNPATTCKGLTTSGRPCRRALAAGANKSPAASPGGWPGGNDNGVVAILDNGDAAAFFCWQHKEQAETLISRSSERTRVLPLREKTSIDTLIDRMGVIELDDEVSHSAENAEVQYRRRRSQVHDGNKTRQREALPHEWQKIQGPLMSVPEEVIDVENYARKRRSTHPPNQNVSGKVRQSSSRSLWGCCKQPDDEQMPAVRVRTRTDHTYYPRDRPRERSRSRHGRHTSNTQQAHGSPQAFTSKHPVPSRSSEMHHVPRAVYYPTLDPLPSSQPVTPTRVAVRLETSTSPPNSQTMALLSLIPAHLSPSTTSALLSELSKPVSSADEAGYIYIFWLTPESDVSKPDDETASSLLDEDDIPQRVSKSRSMPDAQTGHVPGSSRDQTTASLTTQALQRFASIKHASRESKKVLLKIGRASNVHRRLSQWSKQCGQNITLIRYYPYHPQRPATRPEYRNDKQLPGRGKPVPHVHRVERLIHLELADQRVADKGKCEQCGREHKEWFEVNATREGLRAVDEVVRRWVAWAQQPGF